MTTQKNPFLEPMQNKAGKQKAGTMPGQFPTKTVIAFSPRQGCGGSFSIACDIASLSATRCPAQIPAQSSHKYLIACCM
jgi:hypothetical protein